MSKKNYVIDSEDHFQQCLFQQGERGEPGPPGKGERGETGPVGPKVSPSHNRAVLKTEHYDYH